MASSNIRVSDVLVNAPPSLPVARPDYSLRGSSRGTARKGMSAVRIEFRYPAVLTYQATSRQLPRHHVSTRLAQVEVQEISSQDAPEVISWTPEGSGRTVSFRLINGKVCGLMNANLSHASCRTGEDYPTQPLVALALARLKSIVAEKGPSFVLGDFHDPARWPYAGDNWHPQAHAEDVTEWESYFAACVADMALVDGQLWRATKEPMVVVYRNTAGWQTALTPGSRSGRTFIVSIFPWTDGRKHRNSVAPWRSARRGPHSLERFLRMPHGQLKGNRMQVTCSHSPPVWSDTSVGERRTKRGRREPSEP